DDESDHHWRGFAKKAGYALGFDSSALARVAESQGFLLGPVRYKRDALIAIASAVLADHLPQFASPLTDTDRGKLNTFVVKQILTLAPFFKRHSFESEREWRLVKVAPLAGLANMKFMSQPRFGLKSYVELGLDGEPHIIPEIVVGPGHETLGFAKIHNPSDLF